MTLTPRQTKILDFLHSYIAENKVSPSYREIGEHIGATQSMAFVLIRQMEERGAVKVKRGRFRSIEPVEREPDLSFLAPDLLRGVGEIAARELTKRHVVVGEIIRAHLGMAS